MPGKPIKCGMKINPPAFITVYRWNEKLKRKVMPLRNFKSTSNVKFVARELSERHELTDIPLIKIEKILRLLQEMLKGVDKEKAVETVEKEFMIRVNEDLNKLPSSEVEFQKQLMDSIFLKNQVTQNSDNFIYDKQIDFDNQKEESNWDDDNDEDDDDKKDAFWD